MDRNILRFNQVMIIMLLALGLLFNQVWLVAAVAMIMLIGTINPSMSVFKSVYVRGVKKLVYITPDIIDGGEAPHLFAQGLGSSVLFVALLTFTLGETEFGWILTSIVIILASINLIFDFCLGCFIHYQLKSFKRNKKDISPIKANSSEAANSSDPLSDIVAPAIIYFTADWCRQCHIQVRIMEQVHFDINIYRIDADERNDIAKYFGVMSLPTTIILDKQKVPVMVKHGVANIHAIRDGIRGLNERV